MVMSADCGPALPFLYFGRFFPSRLFPIMFAAYLYGPARPMVIASESVSLGAHDYVALPSSGLLVRFACGGCDGLPGTHPYML